MATHTGHDHPATPAGRAACRRASRVALPTQVARIVAMAEREGLTVKSELGETDKWTRAKGTLDLFKASDAYPTHIWIFWSVNARNGRVRRSAYVYHAFTSNSRKIKIRELWSWCATIAT